MDKTNLATLDANCNGNSSSEKNPSEIRANPGRSSTQLADGNSRSRPIGAPDFEARTLPSVNAGNTYLATLTKTALKHLQMANTPPYLFRHGGFPAWLEWGDDGAAFVRILNDDHVRHELARTMRWGEIKNEANKWIPVLPPMAVVKDIMATPNLPFPVLDAIVQVPVFGRDGRIQLTPGYHPSSRTYYLPEPGFNITPILENPSPVDVTRARQLLDELIVDFPCLSEADKAHGVAFSLLFYARNLIKGPTPLHLVEKPTPGTGATLLINALTWPAIGRPLPAMSEATDDEEWRKRITAQLRTGPAGIVIDNVRRPLDSAALAAAITATVWEDRLLGHNHILRLPVRCAWAATANNPALSPEIARRTVRIRLDAKLERPWLDRQFRHPELMAWVMENRAELVWAHLVLTQAWIAAGRPRFAKKLGMFEGWSEVIGGILEVASIPGFLGNLAELYETSDPEENAFDDFIHSWWLEFGDKSVGVNELLKLAQQRLDLGGNTPQAEKIRLGKLLNRNRERRFGQLRLAKAAKYQGSVQWKLVLIKE